MKRPSYRAAVYWIAMNDDAGHPDAGDPEVVSGLISVCLVADLFGKENEVVAKDVVGLRHREGLLQSINEEIPQ